MSHNRRAEVVFDVIGSRRPPSKAADEDCVDDRAQKTLAWKSSMYYATFQASLAARIGENGGWPQRSFFSVGCRGHGLDQIVMEIAMGVSQSASVSTTGFESRYRTLLFPGRSSAHRRGIQIAESQPESKNLR